MTEASRTLLERYQVRKTRRQKAAFRAWLTGVLSGAGYAPGVEAGGLPRSRNVVAGDPEGAELLLTAHYDTCAELPFPNFITPGNLLFYLAYQLLICVGFFALAGAVGWLVHLLFRPAIEVTLAVTLTALAFCIWWMLWGKANPHTANDNTSGVMTLLEIALALPEEERGRVCLVFFDNEEKGLLGSAAFARAHKRARREVLTINFDCVSDGDHLRLYPGRRVKGDGEAMSRLEGAFRSRGAKQVQVCRGFGFYPSDQGNFRRGVGVCALKRAPVLGHYMNRIHTRRDRVLDEANIRLLRDSALRLLELDGKENARPRDEILGG